MIARSLLVDEDTRKRKFTVQTAELTFAELTTLRALLDPAIDLTMSGDWLGGGTLTVRVVRYGEDPIGRTAPTGGSLSNWKRSEHASRRDRDAAVGDAWHSGCSATLHLCEACRPRIESRGRLRERGRA